MKEVAAIRHHSQHLAVSVVAQADRTRGGRVVGAVFRFREGEFRVRVDDGLLEPDDEVVAQPVVVVVVLGYEDNAREYNSSIGGRVWVLVPVRFGIITVVMVVVVVVARSAAAEVRGEEEGGEEDEEAESNGDGVTKADAGSDVLGKWVSGASGGGNDGSGGSAAGSGGGGGGHWERE